MSNILQEPELVYQPDNRALIFCCIRRERERKREEAPFIKEKREYCENLAFGIILSEQQWICQLEELRVKEDLNLTA